MPSIAYALSVETFRPVLGVLSNLLDKGAEQAKANGTDADILAGARLAPDMFTLGQQVQQACAYALDGASRLAGRETPTVETGLETLGELKVHIARTLDALAGLDEAAFSGAEERRIVLPLMNELVLDASGLDFLRAWTLPQFYFHVVTAYDILRHKGVSLGKLDYMSHVAPHVRASGS